MLSQDQFQDIMRTLSDKDKERRSVEVSGPSVDDALSQAAIELGVPVRRIEYELLEKGKRGFLGIGKKEYSLIAYAAEQKIARTAGGEIIIEDFEEDEGEEEKIIRNGDFSVRLSSDGAYLKVIAPDPGGIPVDRSDIVKELNFRAVHDIDDDRLNSALGNGDGVFVKVGRFCLQPCQ